MKRLAGKKSPASDGTGCCRMGIATAPETKITCKEGLSRREIVHVFRGGREQTTKHVRGRVIVLMEMQVFSKKTQSL